MSSRAEAFLSVKEEEKVVEAIRIAEKATSGEIRVHLESYDNKEVYKRCLLYTSPSPRD